MSLVSRLAENQLWCQLWRQMLTHLLGKRYFEHQCPMSLLQSTNVGLGLGFLTLCPSGVEVLESKTFRIWHTQTSVIPGPLILTYHHSFSRLPTGRVIRHGMERKDSSPAGMFTAFYWPPCTPRHARSFGILQKSQMNFLFKDSL